MDFTMFQNSSSNNRYADITMDVLIKSLFEEGDIKELLKNKDASLMPLNRIFSIILDPCLNDYYNRYSFIINYFNTQCASFKCASKTTL